VVALETGMRASEIASRPRINGRVAFLVDTKNGEAREVPLSVKAVESFPVELTAGSISGLFTRLTEELGFPDLTFHCLRRTAATRLSKLLDPWELCRMFGWKDLRIPLKHYYSASSQDIAKKL
jgi:integrase